MKKNIKVLLMTSKDDIRDFIVATAPPVGLWRLRQYLLERGIECDVADLRLESEERYARKVEEGEYNIIGMSVTHHNMIPELSTIWRCRAASKKSPKRCLFVAGGQAATLNHKQWLESGGIDVVLLGFAEKSLYELCLRFSEAPDNIKPYEFAEGMDGYALLDKDGQVIYKPTKPLTQEDFREFSFRQVLKMDVPYKSYWKELRRATTAFGFHQNIFIPETVRPFTASHCLMVCGYCSSRSFIPESQKQLSPVIMLSANEVHQLILHYINKYGAKGFLFADDDFLVGSSTGIKRVFDFCKLVIESKNNGTMPKEIVFNCQARIDDFLTGTRRSGERPIRWELIKIMKEAGFHSFGIGVETFSDRLLKCKSINKTAYNESDTHRVLDAILKCGLIPTTNLILAVPESTVEDMVHSMKAGVEHIIKGCQLAVTMMMDSFPGSTAHTSKDYKVMPKKWKNPYTGEVVVMTNYFIPDDPKIASIIDQTRQAAAEEEEKVKKRASWDSPLTPKLITSLSFMVGTTRLLGLHDLSKYFADVAYDMLCKEKVLAGKA